MSWTNLVDRTNIIRFIRRAIVEFNYYQFLELNSSELNSTAVRHINRAFIIVRIHDEIHETLKFPAGHEF